MPERRCRIDPFAPLLVSIGQASQAALVVRVADSGRVRAGTSAVIRELKREVVVLGLDQGLHRLQVVAALAAHPELVTLDLCLDPLRALVADELGDLLGVLLADPFTRRRGDLVELSRAPR